MAIDPLAGSSWSTPQTVEGFKRARPNEVLLQFAERERRRIGNGVLLDIGCGAGRNAVPLAQTGWTVVGTDLSWPMAQAARQRAAQLTNGRLSVVLAAMERLPVRPGSVDLVVAHGIWNLARSTSQFRRAVRQAAQAAKPDAGLFVFTFSRNTFPPETEPVEGQSFVFTQFSGGPQCFLTEEQLVAELRDAGFLLEPGTVVREYNRPAPGTLATGTAPAIYEGMFRRVVNQDESSPAAS